MVDSVRVLENPNESCWRRSSAFKTFKKIQQVFRVQVSRGKFCRIALQFALLKFKLKIFAASLPTRSRCFYTLISQLPF